MKTAFSLSSLWFALPSSLVVSLKPIYLNSFHFCNCVLCMMKMSGWGACPPFQESGQPKPSPKPLWFQCVPKCQNGGPAPHSDILAPFGKNVSFGWVKLKKNFWSSMIPIKCMNILQKNWTKTVNSALSSDTNILRPAIWGHHHQLDDHHRNPNSNTEII